MLLYVGCTVGLFVCKQGGFVELPAAYITMCDFFHCILLFLTEVCADFECKTAKDPLTLADIFVIQYIQYKYIVRFSNAYNYWPLKRQACFCCPIIMINCLQRPMILMILFWESFQKKTLEKFHFSSNGRVRGGIWKE